MAETKEKSGYKKITLRRPAGEMGDTGKIVGINGKMYSVPYEREVEVPEGVYEIIKASEEAAERQYKIEKRYLSAGEIL